MSNPSKAKGSAAEKLVAEWLQEHGRPHVERRALAGTNDRGDIAGIPGVVIEIKDYSKPTLPQFVRELDAEIMNAKAWTGTIIAKRRGTLDVGEWFAIQPVRIWHPLLTAAGA